MFNKAQPQALRPSPPSVPRDLSPTNLPSSQAAVSSAAPAGPAAAKPIPAAAAQLVVGPTINLKGAEIFDCDTLIVEGLVEATIDSRVIRVAKKGIFIGSASADIAEVWGRFEGALTVRGLLIVHASGQVTGKIRYAKIRVEEGGELHGDFAAAQAETVDGAIDRSAADAGRSIKATMAG
jgi:cytoskeletal protein CcmA (bactofilin family)